MALSVLRTALGLQSQYNQANLPPGSLLEADNVVIDREGTISKARGYERYGIALPETISAFLEFDSALIAHAGTQLLVDADGVGGWSQWAGAFSAPDATRKIHAIEMNGVLHLTTLAGIMRTDALSKSPVPAGMPYALSPVLTKYGSGQGWLSGDSQAAYRVLWGRSDARGNLLIGAPSFSEKVVNPRTTGLAYTSSGAGPYTVTVTHASHGYLSNDYIVFSDAVDTDANGEYQITVTGPSEYTYSTVGNPGTGTISAVKACDVSLRIPVPDGIVAGDFYEVYRTDLYAGIGGGPGDRLYKVFRGGVRAADVPARHIDLAWARTLAVVTITLTGHGFATGDEVILFASSATTPLPNSSTARASITRINDDTFTVPGVNSGATSGTVSLVHGGFLDFVDILDDSFLGIELYTNANQEGLEQVNARPPFAKDICRWKEFAWFANTKKPEYIQVQLISVTGIADGTDTIAWTMGATTRTYTWGASEAVFSQQFKRWTTYSTDAEDVRETAKSFVRAVNEDPGNTLLYAYYVSGEADAPGYVVLEARAPNGTAFTLTVNSGTPSGVWSPELPSTGTDVESLADVGTNRLYHSKLGEPEAVPDFNYEEIGGRMNRIERILPLRDALIILTTEGAFRVSGDDELSFTYTELDPSVQVRAPEAAVILNNAVYCLATQGVVRITDSGTSIISRPIEEELKDIFDEATFDTKTFAVGYESDRRYQLWTPLTVGGAQVSYVYNYLTKQWTRRLKNVSCAFVLRAEDRLFLGHSADKTALRERKNFYLQTDYRDETIPQAIDSVGSATFEGSAVSTVRITWDLTSASRAVGVGDQVYQAGVGTANVMAVEDLTGSGTTRQYELTLDRALAFTPAACGVSYGIASRVRWAPETLGQSVATLKKFSAVQVYLEDLQAALDLTPWRFRLGFASDLKPTEVFTTDFKVTTMLGGHPLRSTVPMGAQTCRSLNLIFEHNRAGERFDIVNVGYSGEVLSDRTSVTTVNP